MGIGCAQHLSNDKNWMQMAVECAKKANDQGEIPVGAVVVKAEQLIGQGWNQTISRRDPSAHAEIIALRQAAKFLDNYRILGATLYVTLEPCVMCAGALVHARIERLVYAASDPQRGAVESGFNVLQCKRLNHQIPYCNGVLAEQAGALLKVFFKLRR